MKMSMPLSAVAGASTKIPRSSGSLPTVTVRRSSGWSLAASLPTSIVSSATIVPAVRQVVPVGESGSHAVGSDCAAALAPAAAASAHSAARARRGRR